mmetsp:Transcript_2107/g.5280  ORF Transcript_2107/g.5280 Transcript_2107/m.5280 type:complete len:254 (+) Transcript_2107:505-1266(+)
MSSHVMGHSSHSTMSEAVGRARGWASLNSASCSTTVAKLGLMAGLECTHFNARLINAAAFSVSQSPVPGRPSSNCISSASTFASITSCTVPVGSVCPSSTISKDTPTLYTSLAARYSRVCMYRGSMKPWLPATLEWVASRLPPMGTSLASPTSVSLAMPPLVSMMFEGLKSRCMMAGELLCRKSSATEASNITRRRTSQAMLPAWRRSCNVPPAGGGPPVSLREHSQCAPQVAQCTMSTLLHRRIDVRMLMNR